MKRCVPVGNQRFNLLSRTSEYRAAIEDWQERWHDFTQQAAEPARNQEVQRTRIEQFESVDQKTQERLARLDEEDLKLLEEEEQLDVEGTRTVSSNMTSKLRIGGLIFRNSRKA
ncbi:MAG: hypothetical protein Ct9H300mP14_11700 [Gammaproteobacteria bacterium]|nr:MAG: hypothetical protein Ct9H300mP14_11700 [Gammaproteobacteria bacterium]